MIDEEVTLSGDDHRILWKKLFIDKIFTTLLDRPQFWVLDAINECSDKNGSGLVSMLSSIDSKTPVRVFITSQPGENITRLLAQNHASYVELKTGEERSLQDIELFLTAKCAHIAQDSSSPNLVADILSRSNGSFLWASITAMNLESIYSVEDMQKIMDQVPSEMDAYYSRIIDSIMQSPSAELAMCVLRWAISSPTPLSTAELADAVKLDINKTLTATPRQLEKMAGHLIVVDSQNLVQPLHHTAWHYLTEQQGGSFRIDLTDAHSRIAKICLMVLCGNGFASPRSRSGGQIHETRTEIPRPLSNYAALNFSYHILHSAPLSEDSIILLSKFFTSNILTWIERMATTGDLSTLLHTAQRLKTYIDRQAQQDGKLKDDLQIISAWLIDLYQIATVFHSYLVASPMSIHLFVPYLCPPNSMIRQLFAKRIKHQRVTGSTEDDWNDRLASFVFPNEASSLAINSRFLAVGLQSGDISLFSAPGSSTIRPVRSLTHGKKVRQVVINSSSTLLASCSPRNLKLWDISRSSDPSSHCLWSQDIDFIPSEVLFSSDGQSLVLTNPQSSSLVIFGLVDGKKEKLIPLHISSDPDSSDEEGQELTSWWTSCSRIRVDAYSKLAALSSRNSSVCIWDLAATEMLGVFDKEGHQKGVASPPVVDLIFNPVPELELLAIAYMHGDLVICNPWTLEQTKLRRLQFSIVNFGATSDGRILAGGSDDSVIHLFLFKTLQSIYRIPRPAEDLQLHQIAFSPDNLRLFDIRGQCCNVWEPLILKPEMETDSRVQDVLSDHQSLQVSTASTAQGLRWSEAIMVIEQTEDDNFLFVGRQDGSIDIFDVDAGTVIDKLQLHDQFTAVMHLDWNQDRGILLSSDTTGRCIMTELSFLSEEQKPQSKCVLDHRERQPLRQILISTSATRFLMQKDSEAKILDFRGDVLLEDSSLSQVYWTNHPTDSTVLVGVQLTQVHLYDWSSGSRISLVRGIPLTRPLESQWISIGGWVDRRASNYLARGFTTSTRPTGSTLVSLRTSNITVDSNEAVLQILELTSINMQTIIGVLRSNLYFLDTAGWVCSVNIKNLEELTQYTRHFFIPQTWQIGGDVVIRIISKSILAFARGEQLILFHGFLDFEERLALIDEAVGAG
jgi:WD40 repeat protein